MSAAQLAPSLKNGQNREVPEAGRKIYLSLILGLNGAAKSHFGPILGPLGGQYTFWDSKTSIQGTGVLFLQDLEPFVSKNGDTAAVLDR